MMASRRSIVEYNEVVGVDIKTCVYHLVTLNNNAAMDNPTNIDGLNVGDIMCTFFSFLQLLYEQD